MGKHRHPTALILNINAPQRRLTGMKHLISHLAGAALLALVASTAQAACYADYKAKRDDPLRLHYGVAALSGSACSAVEAQSQLAPRLAQNDWVLLNVISVFGPEGLTERRDDAGRFFLRF